MFDKILGIWLSGGWVMVPLALHAVTLYSTGIHMLLYLRSGNFRFGDESDWLNYIKDPSIASGHIGEIIHYTQDNVHTKKQVQNRFEEVRQSILRIIERRLLFLNTLIGAAPLLGLLGTVIGMIVTFAAISSGAGNETAGMVAEGISEALITTQTGLFIALPGVFLSLIITNRKHMVEANLARIESLSLSNLKLQ
jgi:biopolymer transport protein ExbB